MTVEATNTRHSGEPEAAWSFVRWFLATVVVGLLAVAGLNAWIDPTGTLGTGMVDPMAELPRDRAAKVAVLKDDPAARVVVLGSSRSKRIDFERAGMHSIDAVNAAVVGSDILEARILTRWLAERRTEPGSFPHLVLGIDVEQFRASSLRETGMLGVPAIARAARAEAHDEPAWALAPKAGELLLSWSAARQSIDTLRERHQLASAAASASRDPDRITLTRSEAEFDANGILRSDRRYDTAAGRSRLARQLPQALRQTLAEYRDRYDTIGVTPARSAVRDLHALVRIANGRGDVPAIFLTPMHPLLARSLASAGRTARHARVVALLRREAAAGRISFVDCSRCVPGLRSYWSDGVHLAPLGARYLARRLRALAAPPSRPLAATTTIETR